MKGASRCNNMFTKIVRTNDETYLSAFCHASQAHSWLPSAHADPRRAGRHQGAARARRGPIERITERFRPHARLKKADEFSSVFRFKCVRRSPHLFVHAKPN